MFSDSVNYGSWHLSNVHFFFSPTGSGSLAAMAVFEDRYKPDMEVILPLVYFIQFN